MSIFANKLKQPSMIASFHIKPRLYLSPSTFRLLTLGLLLTFQSCGFDVEDPTPPSPPVWVQKSLPEEWPERGIDAHESKGIILEWEGSLEEDIAVYLIYRTNMKNSNDSLFDFVLLARIEAESNYRFEYLDSKVAHQTTYYYKLAAEDASGNRSGDSAILKYVLLEQINESLMTPNGIDDSLGVSRQLRWQYLYTVEMEDYCITVVNNSDELVVREIKTPEGYLGEWEGWKIPDHIFLETGQIYRWRIDAHARYLNGLESAGSESHWASFMYAE